MGECTTDETVHECPHCKKTIILRQNFYPDGGAGKVEVSKE